jgi:hypothetical protein
MLVNLTPFFLPQGTVQIPWEQGFLRMNALIKRIWFWH